MQSSINLNPKITMFNSEHKELKKLPCGATKSQILQMYPRESDTYMRKLMQSIQIENNPQLPEKMIKNRKRLNRKEVKILIEVLGTPKGYQNTFIE